MTAIHSNCQDEQRLITGREGKKNTNICSHTETVIYNPFTFCMQVHGQRPTHTCTHTHTHTHTVQTQCRHKHNMQTLKTKPKVKKTFYLKNICLKRYSSIFNGHILFVLSSNCHFFPYKRKFALQFYVVKDSRIHN